VAYRVCTWRRDGGCPTLVDGGGRCPAHQQSAEQARGTAAQRGYNQRGHTHRFRPEVLAKHDGICVLCQVAPATVADHWPLSRRELEARGMDPDDPAVGRPLCAPCHGGATATNQPGGWNTSPADWRP
jgi:5-methylcytosine-specific restriction protein A